MNCEWSVKQPVAAIEANDSVSCILASVFYFLFYLCAMRLLTFFMAILVLSLSCLPCGDVSNLVLKEGKAKYELSKCADGDQHEDDCSPFCHCSCCAGFSIYHQVAVIQQSCLPSAFLHATRYIETIREVSIPVWQPPQLG